MCGWVTSVIVNSPFRGNEIDESEARVLQKGAELRRDGDEAIRRQNGASSRWITWSQSGRVAHKMIINHLGRVHRLLVSSESPRRR